MPTVAATGIRAELLDLLLCPDSRQKLSPADAQIVSTLNRGIVAGIVENRAGELVDRPIDGGLIRQDGELLYPILDGIPILLIDEAIPLVSHCRSANTR